MISIISQCSINPLTPGAFCQKSIFGYFGDFSASIWAELASIYYSKRHLQHDSMPFFPLELHFTTVLLRHVQKSPTWPMSLWFFFSFSPSHFSPFLIFLQQWLTFYWACLIPNFLRKHLWDMRFFFPWSMEV